MGTRPIDDAALLELARAAVDAFLRIFGPPDTTDAGTGVSAVAGSDDRARPAGS
ncbi:hypothetical protein [Amycolatopsis viridis]|uniref:Uncharacterized protein n=1 Tax=Amycolatopsis viridis TaxID=185678 RepID=A0ABX0SYQ3_9PSEU|nr:hypothetical protein [Amycolatopsis viridis]NIH80421.1 hypothetical protein [Amycolatopsis viridis]